MECDSLILRYAAATLLVATAHGADRDFLEPTEFPRTATIHFHGDSATVSAPAGVTVTRGAKSSHVIVESAIRGLRYLVSGSSDDGFLEIHSDTATLVQLDALHLVSTDGPALSMLCNRRNHVLLTDGTASTLADATVSTRSGSGALYSSGPIIMSGDGRLEVAGFRQHAISTADYYRALGGEVSVTRAVKDGVHANDLFRMDQGWLSVSASGDGIDADAGEIDIRGGSIRILSTADDVKGIQCDGNLSIRGGDHSLTVDGDQSKAIATQADLTITGGCIAVSMAGSVVMETVTGSFTYQDPSYATALKADGELIMEGGSVTITHTGTAGKGISTGGGAHIAAGTLDVAVSGGTSASYTNSLGTADVAAADCVKSDGALTVTGGTVIAHAAATSADALSSDTEVRISGGELDITVSGSGGHGVGSRQSLEVTGGNLVFTSSGPRTKALKSTSPMTLAGGTLSFAMTGTMELESVATGRFDPSYCTAVKCDADLTISAGTIAITHSGQAGKGISCDGSLTMTGGTVTVATTGANSASYTNAAGLLDMAAADAIRAAGNLTLTGGTIDATSSGAAGDAVSCDGIATIGSAGASSGPALTARTSGARVLLSGSGNSADYVNPKALQSAGNLNLLSGFVVASTTQNGGEGIESKGTLTISGGTVEVTAYDDAINAATRIAIGGGTVYCYSSNNDGIDSNGTIGISGGLVISSGNNAPECGFDCDSANFAVTGGVMIGTGGSTSTPTAASTTQRCAIYRGAGTANVILQVRSAAGANVLTYRIPRTYAGGGGGGGGTPMSLLFSTPSLAAGTTYSIISGATVTGGTEYRGYITGATVSGGTTLRTFTPTNMVTTVQ